MHGIQSEGFDFLLPIRHLRGHEVSEQLLRYNITEATSLCQVLGGVFAVGTFAVDQQGDLRHVATAVHRRKWQPMIMMDAENIFSECPAGMMKTPEHN